MLKSTWSRGLALFVVHDVLLALLLVWSGVVHMPTSAPPPGAHAHGAAMGAASLLKGTRAADMGTPPAAWTAEPVTATEEATGATRSLFSADDVLEIVNARLAEAEAERVRARGADDFEIFEDASAAGAGASGAEEPRVVAGDLPPLEAEHLPTHARNAERYVAEKRGTLDTRDTDPEATDATVLVESALAGVSSVCLSNTDGASSAASTVAASDVEGVHMLALQSDGGMEFTTADAGQGVPYAATFNGPLVSLSGVATHQLFSTPGVEGGDEHGVDLTLSGGNGVDTPGHTTDGGNVVLSPGVGNEGGVDGELIVDADTLYVPRSKLSLVADGKFKFESNVEASADLTVRKLLATDTTLRLASSAEFSNAGNVDISTGGSVATWDDSQKSNPFFAGDHILFADTSTEFLVTSVSTNFITIHAPYDGATVGGQVAVDRKPAKLRAFDESGSLWITGDNEMRVAELVAQGVVEGDTLKGNSLKAVASELAVYNSLLLEPGTSVKADTVDVDNLFARTGSAVSVYDLLYASAGVKTDTVSNSGGDLLLAAARTSQTYIVAEEDKGQAAAKYAWAVTTNSDVDNHETMVQGRFFLNSAGGEPAASNAVVCLMDDGGLGYCSDSVAGNSCVCTRIGFTIS